MLTVIRMIANRFCLGMPGPLIACSMASMPYLTNYIDRISSLPPSAGARRAARRVVPSRSGGEGVNFPSPPYFLGQMTIAPV